MPVRIGIIRLVTRNLNNHHAADPDVGVAIVTDARNQITYVERRARMIRRPHGLISSRDDGRLFVGNGHLEATAWTSGTGAGQCGFAYGEERSGEMIANDSVTASQSVSCK